jgi:hypothetical protein
MHNETLVPLEALASKRDLNTPNSSQLIENHVVDFVVPALRAKSAILGNAHVLPSLSGSELLIPRASLPGVAGSGENTYTGVGTIAPEQLKLSANRYSTRALYSNQWFRQTDPKIANAILGDMILENVATLIDNLCINGTGQTNGQALGILNWPTNTAGTLDPANLCPSITFGGAASFNNICQAPVNLDLANYDEKTRVWIISPATRNKWSQKQIVSGFPRFLFENGKVGDYPAIVTNQLSAANQSIFLKSDETVVALFGNAVSVISDKFTYASQNVTLVTVSILADFGMLRGGAVISTDSAAQ